MDAKMLRWVENAKQLKLERERSLSVLKNGVNNNNNNSIDQPNCEYKSSTLSKMPSKQDVLKLHLLKEKGRGLGVQISGGADPKGTSKGIYISHLLDDGVAARDGRLRLGDEILFINGLSLISKTHKEATQLLQSTSNPVQVVISRQITDSHADAATKSIRHNTPILETTTNNNIIESKRVKKHTKEIILINGKDGKKLGFSIIGGADDLTHQNICIKNIMQGGVISQDGRLKTGDIILKVNDIPLSAFKHHEAISLFKSLKKGPVKFLVQRRPATISTELGSPSSIVKDGLSQQVDVVLTKEAGKGFGIGFGQSNKSGVFVKYIAKGSLVAKEGNLQLKDHITSLNGISMKDTQLEDFHKIIRNLQPGKVYLSIQRNKTTEPQEITHDTMSSSRSTSSRTSKSSDQHSTNRSNNNKNNLATLMSPAIPVKERYTRIPKNKKIGSSISFDSSDDEFNPYLTSPRRTGDDCSSVDSLKRKGASNDGWFRRNSLKTELQPDSNNNPDDKVIEFPDANKDENERTQQSMRVDGTDCVIIERDKTGSLGLSIKMKKTRSHHHNGVFAKNVAPNGSADKAVGSKNGGVKSGDRIVQVNHTRLDSLSYNDVIAFFKKIPKKSTFTLKRVSSQDATICSKQKSLSRPMTRLASNSDDVFAAPNVIADEYSPKETFIQRSSVLNSSIKHSLSITSKRKQRNKVSRSQSSSSTDPIHSIPDKPLSSLIMSGRPQFPLTTMLSVSKNDGVLRAATFKVSDKQQGIGVPLPEASEIPDNMNVHLIEMIKDDKQSLGISLVPASGKCSGYFLVRRVQPGSVCEENGQIFKDDCIYSVNGISLNRISHPQALQILKQCSSTSKIVLFRDKFKDQEFLNHVSFATAEPSPLQNQKQINAPPGTIATENKQNLVRPTLHRRTTDNSSLISIPFLDNNDIIESSPVINKGNNTLRSYSTSLGVPSRSDGDESSGDNSSNPRTPLPLPKVHAVNKRSVVGAFVIEYEKLFKGLGLDVMMDELGVCYITNISLRGAIGSDERLRVGDNLVAINKESVHGKPISDVRDIIRSVPRGKVEIMLRASNDELVSSVSTRRNSNMNGDDQSVVSTSTYHADPHSSVGMSVFSLPLPNDMRSKVPAQHSPSFNKYTPHLRSPSIDTGPDYGFPDDQSDVTLMPPAPPRPTLPSEFGWCLNDENEEDSDVESNFSFIPAPLPPATNFNRNIPKKHPFGGIKLPLNFKRKDLPEDFDDGKSDFYVPPPPPPVAGDESFPSSNESESEEENELQRMNQEYELHKCLSVADYDMQQNTTEPTERNNNVIDSTKTHDDKNQNSQITRSTSVKRKHSRRRSSTKSTQFPIFGSTPITDDTPSKDSGCSETYFPPNSPYHQKDKKKSLFSRLKSKLLLPSKNDITQYETRVKSKKKSNKSTQSQLSAVDFKDITSRSKLKASVSQPDLVIAFQQEHKTDAASKTLMKKAESLDERSFPQEIRTRFQSNLEGEKSNTMLRVKALPRILSFRKSPSATPEKKRKQRKASTRSNISPPHTPPPPPPSTRFKTENNQRQHENQFSPFEIIPSPNNHDDENPYESIDRYNFPGNESNVSDTSTNSGGAGSYAAEGPSINKGDTLHDLFLENSMNTKRVLSPNVMKPPPPPKPRSLDTAINAELSNRRNSQLRDENYGSTEDNYSNEVAKEYQGLKKRGSSLLSLNFPPPPPTDDSEKNAQEPLATSSVESSLDISDQDIAPELSSAESSYGCGQLYSEISEQDKSDPKLQPFQMTNELFRTLSPRDSKYDFFDGDDYDDWGSEFSASVVDEQVKFPEGNNYSRYANPHRSDMFTVSTRSKVPSLDVLDRKNATPKRKVQDLKKNLFKRSSSTQMEKEEKTATLSKKEKRKQVKSMPPLLDSNKELSNISSPVLVRRRTASQIFSEKEINVIGSSSTNNPAIDAIINETIRRNTNKSSTLSSPKVETPAFSPTEENISSRYSQQETSGGSINNEKNPVPKPPRRKTLEQMPENGEQYENLDRFQHLRETSKQSTSRDGNQSENVFKFPSAHAGSIELRPVPLIPVTEDESAVNNSNLSEEELNELYSTIDFSKKKCDRESAFQSFQEGSFKVKLVRQAGKSLGLVMVGGYDTAINKILLKEIECNSVSAACEIPLRPGDELVEVNKKNIQGYSHIEALNALKNSPPLLLLTLQRKLNGNKDLLEKESTNESKSAHKINTAAFLTSIIDSSKHSKECEIVQIKDSPSAPKNRPEPPKPNLTVGTFDAEEKINWILKTPPLLPKMKSNMSLPTAADTRKRSQSISSLNTNVAVMSQLKTNMKITSPKHLTSDWLLIDLYKQQGRGLGIAVTGGPNHIIEQGIKVKRLVLESIAGADGRLLKDDLICTINGRDLKGMTQGDALEFLKDIPKVIHLGVRRNNDQLSTNIDASFMASPVSSSQREPITVSSERKSRSKKKEKPTRRSHSETREEKKAADNEKRPRSVSRLSRFFGGSRESINTIGKESPYQVQQQTPTKRSRSRSKSAQLLTIFFEKTEKNSFDFTLTGGMNTMYGDSPIVVEFIRKHSEISKTLKVRDQLVSIQGVDVSKLSKNDAWEYLLTLPVGRVCMVIQRR